MKVAITSEGTTLDDPVDPRFGRCKHFLIADTEAETVETVDNTQNLNAASGAGIQSAETVVKQGVEAVITGHCGPKAFRTLSAAEVAVYSGATGTVREALAALEDGTLTPAGGADVQGHWV